MLFTLFTTAYDDLVVPLQRNCPEAMDVSNKAGVTPRDLLQWMKPEQVLGKYRLLLRVIILSTGLTDAAVIFSHAS